MNHQEFCYWLKGAVELGMLSNPPTQEQWDMIKEHLDLSFFKLTKKLGDSSEPCLPPHAPYYYDDRPVRVEEGWKFPPVVTCDSTDSSGRIKYC